VPQPLPADPSTTRPSAPGRLRLRVLVNRDGGTAARMGVEALRARLAEAFARGGADADLVFPKGRELRPALEQALSDARAGRLDAVAVGGGDGSVNAAASVLAGTGVPLGVLPLGTLNHFAKDVGMPQDLDAAVAAICAGTPPREVDAADVNGRIFVNNSLLGVYPYMVADRERRRRLHGLGKWLAMSLAFLRMLARFPRRRLVLRAEGWSRPYRTPCLFVGVNEYELELFKLQRRMGMDGGQLWLLVAKHTRPLPFAWFAFRAAFRGLDSSDDFELLRVTEVEVRPSATRVPVSADGELERMRGPLRYRIHPRALRVVAPAPAEAQPEGQRADAPSDCGALTRGCMSQNRTALDQIRTPNPAAVPSTSGKPARSWRSAISGTAIPLVVKPRK
jgi:diacylglycerol kinase family enzyme